MSASRLALLRYEEIFDYYSEEPATIFVKLDQNDEGCVCEQILRIRAWQNHGQFYSLSIYAEDRIELRNLIIRSVVWEAEKDKAEVMTRIKQDRESVLASMPLITAKTVHIASLYYEQVLQLVRKLDALIENGIVLHENENPTWEWRDLEVRRVYNWGQTHAIWSTSKKNADVEDQVKTATGALNRILDANHDSVHYMALNYSVSPDRYKDVLGFSDTCL